MESLIVFVHLLTFHVRIGRFSCLITWHHCLNIQHFTGYLPEREAFVLQYYSHKVSIALCLDEFRWVVYCLNFCSLRQLFLTILRLRLWMSSIVLPLLWSFFWLVSYMDTNAHRVRLSQLANKSTRVTWLNWDLKQTTNNFFMISIHQILQGSTCKVQKHN